MGRQSYKGFDLPDGAAVPDVPADLRTLVDGIDTNIARPRGVIAHGTNAQPAANGVMNLSVVDGGAAAWLAANTITLPAGSAGLYLINLDVQWRSSAIVGIRFDVANAAGVAYAPTMVVAVSHNPSTWDPTRGAGSWLRQCADGDAFQVRNRGNAQTAPDYVGVARLSVVRIGTALATA